MEFWHFSETAYPDLPPDDTYESVRVELPNRLLDPEAMAGLWDRYLREWQFADEAGMNVMVNEHHATATCLDPVAPVVASALARLTKNARILILGNPVANRRDPVRIAEEMAVVDILSHGRLEVGFVRGVPYEIAAANSAPTFMSERMWESIDLIRTAWTSHDGPFNWEGRFFQHRHVNIWPRPLQNPMPIWVSTTSTGSAGRIADNDATLATFLLGHVGTRKIFDAYRERAAEIGLENPNRKLAYSGMVYTGRTDEEGFEGARKLLWYLHANKVPKHYSEPVGYLPYQLRAASAQGAKSPYDLNDLSLEELIEHGTVFAGSPATVRGQLERFYERVGGFNHLLLMGQAGHLDHDETVRGISNFMEHVAPAFRGLGVSESVAAGRA